MPESGSATTGEILANRMVARDHFLMRVRLPLSFAGPLPGQFVMIRNGGPNGPLLARPLSVFGFERRPDHCAMELLYRVVGRGTGLFSRMKPGEALCVLGPLGRGFSIYADVKRIVVVAGGVGIAPLSFLIDEGYGQSLSVEKKELRAYLGAGTEDLLTGRDRLGGACDLRICTDDGSLGYRGPVTGLFGEEFREFAAEDTAIYACGPAAMIRELGRLLVNSPLRCEVSIEERMACGVGACLGCAVAVRNAAGGREYRRVCHDGPVFDLKKIIFAGAAPPSCDSGEGGSR